MTLLELLELLKKHLVLVIALPVVCAVAMAVVAYGFMPNVYTAEMSIYVSSQSSSDSSSSTLQSDLNASQLIANDVAALLESPRVIEATASSLGLDSLGGYDISVTSDTSSRVITISVEGEDPQGAADVADALYTNVSEVILEVMDVRAVYSLSEEDGHATVPESPSGPNRTMYVAVAFLAGLFVAVAIVVLLDMLNTRVRSSEDAEALLGVPVIGLLPAVKGNR